MVRAPQKKTLEVFELGLLGGAVERRYRRARPDTEQMPWGTIDTGRFCPAQLIAARRTYTRAAFQEYRTGASCAVTLEAMMSARAPVDLCAMCARFPLEELAHAELFARLAAEVGGGVPLIYDPEQFVPKPAAGMSALERTAALALQVFCIGETFSIPLLRAAAQSATEPLPALVLRRILKDEATHGRFGWLLLDWALPLLDAQGIQAQEHLRTLAHTTLAQIIQSTEELERSPVEDAAGLGFLPAAQYAALAAETLDKDVVAPLRARGIC